MPKSTRPTKARSRRPGAPAPSRNAPRKTPRPAAPPPAYWRDVVGHSGVYPMSGPLPTGNAPVRGQMEFGQGERGAAGYYDAGGSELVYSGGQLLGGLTAGPSGVPEPPAGRTPRARRVPSGSGAASAHGAQRSTTARPGKRPATKLTPKAAAGKAKRRSARPASKPRAA